MADLKLAANFWLSEFIRSEIASKEEIDNTPDQKRIENIRYLCTQVLQPIRDYFGAELIITSGFRCDALNKLVGGSPSSHHMCRRGYAAADFTVKGIPNEDVIDMVRFVTSPSGALIDFDKVIAEPGWIHISSHRPRRQFYVANKSHKGEMVYNLVQSLRG